MINGEKPGNAKQRNYNAQTMSKSLFRKLESLNTFIKDSARHAREIRKQKIIKGEHGEVHKGIASLHKKLVLAPDLYHHFRVYNFKRKISISFFPTC